MELKRPRQAGLRIARSIGTVGAMALISAALVFLGRGSVITATLAFVLAILCAATWLGMAEAVSGAIAAAALLVYYFIPPIHSFKIKDSDDWVDLVAFLATAILASDLSARAKRSANEPLRGSGSSKCPTAGWRKNASAPKGCCSTFFRSKSQGN